MPVNHMKKFYKNEDKKSKELNENDKRKYKKGKDSDSEGDNNSNSTGSENENDASEANGGISDQQKFDIHEYRKMLAEMFPSKYMDNRVSMLEKEKKKSKSLPVPVQASTAAAYDHNHSSHSGNVELAKTDTKKTTDSSKKKNKWRKCSG